MKTRILITIVCSTILIGSCGSSGTKSNETETKKEQKVTPKSDKSLNISIYLDLSDRLKRDITPSQKDRDLAIVSFITDYFKAQTLGPKILQSKNNIKVFFYPAPQSSDIATLASDLSVDMQKFTGKDKRIALEEMKEKFTKNLTAIYDKTMEQDNWPGCDIWDFFSNKNVDTQCIRKDFRNILVILTDGYLFDEKHKVQEGNAFSFVTPSTLKNPNSSLIVKRKGLEDLEVRILEVNPTDINHRDQLVSVLENWLKGMGVKEENITVSETGLPTNTETIIESFLN